MKQMVREHKILDEFGSRLNLNSDDKFELDGQEIGGGGGDKITANDVDSETATQGKVLTANGNGGASWEDASGRKLYAHHIAFVCDNLNRCILYFTIISSRNTPYTFYTLKSYLQKFTSWDKSMVVSSKIISSKQIAYICYMESNTLTITCYDFTTAGSITQQTYTVDMSNDTGKTISDLVIEI